MAALAADGNLLFGLLALQNGLIDQGALFAAFTTWTRARNRSIADILVEDGALRPDDRSLLAPLVARHLSMHGGDPEKSLAAVSVGASTRERLTQLNQLNDSELCFSLARVGTNEDRDAGGLTRAAQPTLARAAAWGSRSDSQVEILADQRARWCQGDRVSVEDYLSREPKLNDNRERLLDLIYNEILLREQHGEHPGPDDYVGRFPALEAAIRDQFEIHRGMKGEGESSHFRDDARSFSVGTSSSEGLRFRVLRPHARGGLGAVYVALDTELHREVALKQILDRHADDPTSRRRFLVEAEIAGGLEHPGIVPVYGLGSYSNGRPFYAMRFIRGDSLKEAIAAFHADASLKRDPGRRSLELQKLLRRFLDVCNAIEYAHSRGVLHRDLKPGNIIVGKHGETLVVDWGLAKSVGRSEPGAASEERTLVPSSASGSAETLPGSVMGTPAFMSPEQAVGDLDRLGPGSDVYSLGATLYVLLTGHPPFEGNDVGAMLEAVWRGGFERPRKLDSSIDLPLEAICLKAMARSPFDRYASPRSLADDIERYMADEPVLAWREPLLRRARRWARRNRTLVVSSVAVLLFGLAGLAGFATVLAAKNRELDSHWRRAQAERDRAEGAERVARDEESKSKKSEAETRTVLEFFRTKVLSAARPEDQEGGLGIDATIRAAVDAAEPGIENSFADKPTVEAAIRDTLGESYMYLGKPELGIRQLERAVAVLRKSNIGPDDPATLDAMANLGLAYKEVGRLDDALPLLDETLALAQSQIRPRPPRHLEIDEQPRGGISRRRPARRRSTHV